MFNVERVSHTEGTELTNGKVKTENGKLVWMILLLIIFDDKCLDNYVAGI